MVHNRHGQALSPSRDAMLLYYIILYYIILYLYYILLYYILYYINIILYYIHIILYYIILCLIGVTLGQTVRNIKKYSYIIFRIRTILAPRPLPCHSIAGCSRASMLQGSWSPQRLGPSSRNSAEHSKVIVYVRRLLSCGMV